MDDYLEVLNSYLDSCTNTSSKSLSCSRNLAVFGRPSGSKLYISLSSCATFQVNDVVLVVHFTQFEIGGPGRSRKRPISLGSSTLVNGQ